MPKRDITIEIGGRPYQLPPLTVATLEEHEAEYDLMLEATRNGRLPDRELLSAIALLLHASLVLKNPELTLEMVKKGMAVGDHAQLVLGLLSQSGFPAAEATEGKPASP